MKYKAKKSFVAAIELLFAAYFIFTIYVAVVGGHWVSLPFLGLFLFGYLFVGAQSIYQRR
ncbi:MAG: hypothetical protein JRF63_05360 [Deltaproteobacteria bacterium]|nr:hypothetical protein [Deltaproteobacteria bacterium]